MKRIPSSIGQYLVSLDLADYDRTTTHSVVGGASWLYHPSTDEFFVVPMLAPVEIRKKLAGGVRVIAEVITKKQTETEKQ